MSWRPVRGTTETTGSGPRDEHKLGGPFPLVRGRKRGDSNPRNLAVRSLSSGADARSDWFTGELTCIFSDARNSGCLAEPPRTETQTETLIAGVPVQA